MADDNGFDVDKIKHGEFMDAKDRRYFEQYGSAMEEQAEIIKEDIKEDIKENYEEKVDDYIKYANEVYDDVMKRLAGNMNQYLVQGACLKCSKQLKTESVQNLFYGDSEIKSKADDVETNSALQILAARTENANGLPFANVTDTRGGLSGELLKGGAKEGEEEENQLNIVSFGNCGFLEEEKITDVEKMAERVLQILHSHSDLGDRCRHNGITKDRIKKGILEGIQSGKGTCYGCMVLNPEWENLPEEYDYAENTFDAMPGAVGIEGFLEGKQYFQFGGKDAINMMSMLFCRFGGGIVNAVDSGQSTITQEDILTDLEKTLLEKYGNFAYEEWDEDKKRCAEEIWNKFYVEGGYDACFVAGLIGNMYGEASCGILQYPLNGMNWNLYIKDGNVYKGGEIVSNIAQIRAACEDAPDDYGIGMLQWSDKGRKAELLKCYKENQSADGTLTSEQLMKSEIEYIRIELPIEEDKSSYMNVMGIYRDYLEEPHKTVDHIEYATCLLFRRYEAPGTFADVDATDFTVKEEVLEKARKAAETGTEQDIPPIIQRIIASKVAYEEFLNK